MKLGISTSCFYPLLTEESLKMLAKGNVKNVEIFFNANCERAPEFISQLQEIQQSNGMTVTSLHPTMSLAESFMLFSDYPRRLAEGMDQYRRYGEIAAQLGADYVIMHGGKPGGVLDDEAYCERFAEIARVVRGNGATLLQENVAKHRAGNLDFLKKMVNCIGDEANFCIDVKQCIRSGYSPFDAVRSVGRHIRHLHISDHSNNADCLLPLDGDFDFAAFFSLMQDYGYSGAAIIEVYKNAYRSYAQIFESFSSLCAFSDLH